MLTSHNTKIQVAGVDLHLERVASVIGGAGLVDNNLIEVVDSLVAVVHTGVIEEEAKNKKIKKKSWSKASSHRISRGEKRDEIKF